MPLSDYALINTRQSTAFGETIVAELDPQAAWRFDYGVNTDLVTTVLANTGAASASSSKVSLSTGTNSAGAASVQSVRRLRYLPGIGGLVRFTVVFNAGVASNTQIIGIGDTNDGFFFGYNGTSFGIMRRRAGVDTWTPQAAWNGDAASFSPQLGNIYQIRYQWLGYGYVRFYVLHPTDPTLGFILVHTIIWPNTSVDTTILNPTLPIYAQTINAGNTSNVVLQSPSAVAFLEGASSITNPDNPLDVHRAFDSIVTFANTSVNHILTIRNKTTYAGVPNRVPVRISSFSMGRGSSAASTSTFRIFKNATFAGALTYADVNTTNSPVEASTTTTTVTSTDSVVAYTITQGGLFIPYSGEIFIYPGETITVSVTNSGGQSTDVSAVLNWMEEF